MQDGNPPSGNKKSAKPLSQIRKKLPRSALAFVRASPSPSTDAGPSSDHNYVKDGIGDTLDENVDDAPLDGGADSDIGLHKDIPPTSATDVRDGMYAAEESMSQEEDPETPTEDTPHEVRWHDPEVWKADLRKLVSGKGVPDFVDLIRVNSALQALEEMHQALQGQGLVASLVSRRDGRLLGFPRMLRC